MPTRCPRISVIVPAYNEETRLPVSLVPLWKTIRRYFPSYELIIVDDGSTDDTKEIAKEFCRTLEGTKLISYDKNRGKGYAVRRGVLESVGELVLYTDVDLSTPFREVRKLQKGLMYSDICIGSRALPDSKIAEYQPLYRVIMGKTFNKVVQLLTVPGIKDTQCGFKLFRGDIARIIFKRCYIDGFGFDVEVLFVAKRLGFSVSEVAVFWRNDPMSKVHPIHHSSQMLAEVLMIKLNSLRGLYTKKT